MGKLDQGVGDYGKAKDRGKEVDEKENEEREEGVEGWGKNLPR